MNRTLLTDLALTPVAGYAGTKLMEPVISALYELRLSSTSRQVSRLSHTTTSSVTTNRR